jgi:hypothetical protein
LSNLIKAGLALAHTGEGVVDEALGACYAGGRVASSTETDAGVVAAELNAAVFNRVISLGELGDDQVGVDGCSWVTSSGGPRQVDCDGDGWGG